VSTEPQSGPVPGTQPAPDVPAQPLPPGGGAPPGVEGASVAGAPGGGAPGGLPHHTIRPTRISGLWVAVAFFAVVLLLLLIFILQNAKTVDIAYFGAHGHLPLGVALLLAAVCGVLLTMLAGAARISQLRAVARRHRRVDAQRTRERIS
jgi:uncharacterized integral membrane protein